MTFAVCPAGTAREGRVRAPAIGMMPEHHPNDCIIVQAFILSEKERKNAMYRYCVNTNAQANGDHEVHKDICLSLPSLVNRKDLGYCGSDEEALRKARQYYQNADGCAHCCPRIHRH